MYRKHIIISMIICWLFFDLSLTAEINQTSDLIKARIALQKYLVDPSQVNAKAFLNFLPIDVPPTSNVVQFKDLLELVERSSSSLIKNAEGGNAFVAEAIFRILNFSDGIVTELLTGILGSLVQKHPRLFLELLNKYRHSTYVSRSGYPLLSTLIEMQSAEGRLAEWELRIEALNTVTDQQFLQLRDECINRIRHELPDVQIIVKQHQEYKQLLDFIKLIRPRCVSSAQFEVVSIPKWNISKVMQVISKSGIVFEDLNDGASIHSSYQDIEKEIVLRRGKAFELLGEFGHLYYFMGDGALAFEKTGNKVAMTLEGFFSLVFEEADGNYYLVACRRLAELGHLTEPKQSRWPIDVSNNWTGLISLKPWFPITEPCCDLLRSCQVMFAISLLS